MGINPTERNFALLLTLRERKTMSELVIKTAKENGDLPKDFDGKIGGVKMDTYQKNLRDKWFFYDEDIAIFWDGDKMFQVQNDGKIVDSFTEPETIATVEKAEQIADDYMAEKLQVRSPDLFRM